MPGAPASLGAKERLVEEVLKEVKDLRSCWRYVQVTFAAMRMAGHEESKSVS
jgi:hypothetical protein